MIALIAYTRHRRFGLIMVPLLALAAMITGTAQGFDLQGHRGARGLMPENTLPGFAGTLAIGVDTLEMDLGMSLDGVLLVTHDPRLNPALTRGATGNWIDAPGAALRSLTLAEIREFDVGRIDPDSPYRARFPEQVGLDGVPIPTLQEVFDLVQAIGNDVVRFNIETKIRPDGDGIYPPPAVFAEKLLALVQGAGLAHRVSIQSFDWRTLQAIQRLAPELPTAYLSAQQDWLDTIGQGVAGPSPWTAGYDIDDFDASLPDMIRHAGGQIWSPYHRDLSAPSLRRAQMLGLQVIPWTVNDPARMAVLLDLGVDGLITDYPDRLRSVMAARDMALPAPTPPPVRQ